MIDITAGLFTNAEFIPSPNYDDRPEDAAIDLLVIHGISLPPNEFGGRAIVDLFCNQLDPTAQPYFATIYELRVSAHLLIRRDGQLLQFVPLAKRAWHAGVSNYQGRERCNDFSIGIELEGADHIPYEASQYHRLAEVTKEIFRVYPLITVERTVGHSDIAPGRKTDPGSAFSWDLFRRLVKE